jgi:cytoskeleton protein RodZ
MSDAPGESTQAEARAVPSASAGAMLRAARQAQGLHVAALAASIKVPQRKLEALEGDRLDELPDVTFARALAKTVCRALKIDPQPVLALMPGLGDQGLEKVHQGLNTTFRDRPARAMPTDFGVLKRPAVWVPLLIVLAAGFVVLMPQQWIVQTRPSAESAPSSASAPADVATATSAPAEAASAVAQVATPVLAEPVAAAPVATVAESTTVPAASEAPASASAVAEGLIQLKVNGESWIEVLDANGAVLLQRKLEAGEFVGLDGSPPFRLKIGNAVVTRLSYRGQPVDLAPSTRDNVARLELK